MRAQRAATICLVLSFIGLGISAYLEYIHIALLRGELVGGLACGAAGSMFNCHTVTASRFGSLLGIPLALWGALGYVITLALSLVAQKIEDWRATALQSLVAVALFSVVIDAALFLVTATQLHQFCPLCLSTYAVNLLLLLVAAWGTGQSLSGALAQAPKSLAVWLDKASAPAAVAVWGIVLTGLAGILAVHTSTLYVARGDAKTFRLQTAQFLQAKKRVTVNIAGNPTHGSPTAPIQIAEFSDFLCPSCQRASTFNPIILAGRSDVVLAFKNFPLDAECNPSVKNTVHPNSCRVAAAAACANEQGRFWDLHDVIFKQGPQYNAADLDRDAAALQLDMNKFQSCLTEGRGMEAVKRDVQEGIEIGIGRTPTYVVNGLIVEGLLSPLMFDELLDALRRSQ